MECSICLEFYSNNEKDKFVAASCGHVFHKSCINGKLAGNRRTSCPNCRKEVKANKLRILQGIQPQRSVKKLKISVLGDSGVGKSCLARRYSNNLFSDKMKSTCGVDYWTKDVYIHDELVQLKIWDTSGQERFGSITPQLVRGSQGVIIAYDTTHVKSLENTKSWLDFAHENAPNAVKILVGCKMDLEKCDAQWHKNAICRGPTEQEKMEMAETLGLHVFETSARSEENVEVVFRDLIAQILENAVILENNGSIKIGRKEHEQHIRWWKRTC